MTLSKFLDFFFQTLIIFKINMHLHIYELVRKCNH